MLIYKTIIICIKNKEQSTLTYHSDNIAKIRRRGYLPLQTQNMIIRTCCFETEYLTKHEPQRKVTVAKTTN